jgi:hypothetical protein
MSTIALSNDGAVLIEVASLPAVSGIAKAGLPQMINHTVEQAADALRAGVATAIRTNVEILAAALQDLATRPDEVELSFGLKVSGEVGTVIVTKISAEANYTVKLSWKHLLAKGPMCNSSTASSAS